GTPCRRRMKSAMAERNPGVPAVCGYPGAAAASASAACTDAGTSSTGVPIDRSTKPSGNAEARAFAPSSESHGNVGSRWAGAVRRGPVMRGGVSCAGGRVRPPPLVLGLRRQGGDERDVEVLRAELRGAARGAELVEPVDV